MEFLFLTEVEVHNLCAINAKLYQEPRIFESAPIDGLNLSPSGHHLRATPNKCNTNHTACWIHVITVEDSRT